MSISLWVVSGVHGLANFTQERTSNTGYFIARFIFDQLYDFAANDHGISHFANSLSRLGISNAKTNTHWDADFLPYAGQHGFYFGRVQ
jgi:hypothetical protein